MKKLAAAIALTLTTSTAMGWDGIEASSTSDGENAYYYAMEGSTRFTNKVAGISAYPHNDCAVKLSIITVLDYVPSDLGSIDAKLNIRVDGGTIHKLAVRYTHDTFSNDGKTKGRATYSVDLTDSQVADIIVGKWMITVDPEEEAKTDKFSLAGSSKAINDVVTACRNHSEWSNKSTGDEWSL
jgi:hypothetical protein